jgi:hypothetical protein
MLHEEAVGKDGCRALVMKGREYKGFVYVDEDCMQTKSDFNYWISHALDFNKKAKTSLKKTKKHSG